MARRSMVDRALQVEGECARPCGLHIAARNEAATVAARYSTTQDEVARVTASRRQLEAAVDAVLRSRSWRPTAPLRAGLAAAWRLALARGRRRHAAP